MSYLPGHGRGILCAGGPGAGKKAQFLPLGHKPPYATARWEQLDPIAAASEHTHMINVGISLYVFDSHSNSGELHVWDADTDGSLRVNRVMPNIYTRDRKFGDHVNIPLKYLQTPCGHLYPPEEE